MWQLNSDVSYISLSGFSLCPMPLADMPNALLTCMTLTDKANTLSTCSCSTVAAGTGAHALSEAGSCLPADVASSAWRVGLGQQVSHLCVTRQAALPACSHGMHTCTSKVHARGRVLGES